MGKNITEIIKPKKEGKDTNNLLTPIMYLILGVILAFKSNEATTLFFYIIGILIILYGVKSLVLYYQNRDNAQLNKINLSIGIVSLIIGILLVFLAEALNWGISFIVGLFLIYMGVSRLLTDYSLNNYKHFGTLSNIILIVFGVYSIFVSNVLLVIIGWILIINAILLFWEFLKK